MQLAPGDFSALNALGLCLSKLDRLRDALEAFEAAIKLKPDFAPAQYNRGWTLETLGELDEARRSYEAARGLNPADPGPLAGLASLAARRGDRTQAEDLARRALTLDPDQPVATLALATAEIGDERFEPAEARLRALLASPRCSVVDRALAHGLLGDIADRQGRPRAAFAEYAASNATLSAHHAPRYAGPEAQTVPAMLDWLNPYMAGALQSLWRGVPAAAPAPAAGHAFILGFPRSGTTLLENVLAARPKVVTLEERETLTASVREFMTGPAAMDRLATATAAELDGHRRAYWTRVGKLAGAVEGRLLIDKLPLNSLKLPLIAKLFPDAKVILALRDPRDVVLSCFRQRFRMNASMFELLTLESAASFYDQVMQLITLCQARLPLNLYVHRYEDLVGDFDASTRAICDFLGLEWSEDLRAFANRSGARAIATPSAPQVARGLYAEGMGQWRAYRDDLAPVLPRLAPWVERLGYPKD